MDADGFNQTKLSSTLFTDDYPAWSPDGSKIVFQSSELGHFEIYTMKADGGGRTRITGGNIDNKYPAWSPDGTKIVFYSKRDCTNDNGEIYIMNADGTGQTRITYSDCTDAGLASWH
jgi:Tol biopolymer transport system component